MNNKSHLILGLSLAMFLGNVAIADDNLVQLKAPPVPYRVVQVDETTAQADMPRRSLNSKALVETPTITFGQTEPSVHLKTASPLPASEYWIGVQCAPVLPLLRSHLNLGDDQAVMVEWVMPESPADKAGFKQYDILLKFDDTPVASVEDIINKINKTKDAELTIKMIRQGKPFELKVIPEKRPADQIGHPSFNIQMLTPQHGTFQSMSPGVIIPNERTEAGTVTIPLPENFLQSPMQQADIQKMIEMMQKRMQDFPQGHMSMPPIMITPHMQGVNTKTIKIDISSDKLEVSINNNHWAVERFEDLPADVQKEVTNILKNNIADKDSTGEKAAAKWVAEQMASGRRLSFTVSTVNTIDETASENTSDTGTTELDNTKEVDSGTTKSTTNGPSVEELK